MDSEAGGYLAFVKLKILSVMLIAITIACASLRLLPVQWTLRGTPLCRLTWPAIAVGLLSPAVWFIQSVTPYSVPGFDHPAWAEMRILHIQKRGLQIDETMVMELKDGRVLVYRDRRRLFQYRFEGRAALGKTSQTVHERARSFIQSSKLWNAPTAAPEALRSWNAEGWYVVLKDQRLLAFTTEYNTTPPGEVTDLFHELEKLPASAEWTFAVRDVCLGFCYDPVAALGFSVAQQRARLLSPGTSVRGL